jgi:DNA-binding NarL/FixJ family response regulator
VVNSCSGSSLHEGPATIEPQSEKPQASRVLAVDDQPHFRRALRSLIEATWSPSFVYEADSGEAGVASARALQPDVVLIDVQMPGLDGVCAANEIKELRPETLVLLISTTHPCELRAEAFESRADGVLWKGELCPKVLGDLWTSYAERTYG